MSSDRAADSAFEALFRQAVIDEYMDEIDAIPSKDELAKQYVFSPRFEVRMKKVFARERRRDISKTAIGYTKKAASILLILTGLLFGALLLNPDVRAAVGRAVVEWYEEFTTFGFRGGGQELKKRELGPRYMTEGYLETVSELLNDLVYVSFMNDTGEEIYFSYNQMGNSTKNIAVDNEHHSIHEGTINGEAAYIITALDDDYYNGLIFEVKGTVVDMWGTALSVEELIKIAESFAVSEE